MSKTKLIEKYELNHEFDQNYKELTTLELMGLLRDAQVDLQYYNNRLPNDPWAIQLRKIHGAIKKELATRPNIPTKEQAKKIRQEKAKLKQNR